MKPILFLSFWVLLSGCSASNDVDEYIATENSAIVSRVEDTVEIKNNPVEIIDDAMGVEETIDNDIQIDPTSHKDVEETINKRYLDFDKNDLAVSLEKEYSIVFHFYDEDDATDHAFRQDVGLLHNQIPSDVRIYARPYSIDDVLVKKYGVKRNNTFIFVDAQLEEKHRMSKGIVRLKTIQSRF